MTRAEETEIASTLHLVILDALFRASAWKAPQAVFHGGTSLAIARRSRRFSEDLDFMVDEGVMTEVEGVIRKTLRVANTKIGILYPGATLEIYGPKGKAVTQWSFRWQHPNRRERVSVKLEFLSTPAELLSRYRTTHIVPMARRAHGFSITSSLPVPQLISAWADKINSIATRSIFKWRDIHDLAFIADMILLDGGLKDDDRAEALLDVAAIYGDGAAELQEGLGEVRAKGLLDDPQPFEDDMRRWFDEVTWQDMKDGGMFLDMLRKADREIERATTLLAEHTPGVKP